MYCVHSLMLYPEKQCLACEAFERERLGKTSSLGSYQLFGRAFPCLLVPSEAEMEN